jgi:hypothetical protein
MKKSYFLLFFIFFITNLPIFKLYSNPNLPLNDSAYHKIDILISHGLIKNYIYGQRPWSHRRIVNMLLEAEKNSARIEDLRKKEFIDKILNNLDQKFSYSSKRTKENHLHFVPLEDIEIKHSVLKSELRKDTKAINTHYEPLQDYRGGRALIPGVNSSLETSHYLSSKYLSVYLKPRFQFQASFNGEENEINKFYFQQLYSKFHFNNFELLIGRDELLWGQGNDYGMVLSSNAKPLDMIKISNDETFRLPWLFRYLGNMKLSFFYSDLGEEDQRFANPYLVGYKFSLKPAHFLELGFYSLTLGGGEGSPEASLSERIRDILPVEHIFNLGAVQQPISNKIGGMDLRISLPFARYSQIYAEMLYDDIHNISSKIFLIDDAAYYFGISMPRLDSLGRLALNLEYEYTGKRFFTHGQFTDGWTRNRKLLGSSLGSNSKKISSTLKYSMAENKMITWKNEFYIFSKDNWAFTVIDDGPDIFVKHEDFPEEYRFLSSMDFSYEVNAWTQVNVLAAYERIKNFNFVSDSNKNHFLFEFAIKIHFDKISSLP